MMEVHAQHSGSADSNAILVQAAPMAKQVFRSLVLSSCVLVL
jgi:hypothetical protein